MLISLRRQKMKISLAMIVIASLGVCAFALMPTQKTIPDIRIEYPNGIPADENLIKELDIERPLVSKIDPISKNFVMLICEPLATGISVSNVNNARTAALEFAQKYSRIIGVPAEQLRIENAEKITKFWNVSLHQKYEQYDVIGSRVMLRINNLGEIFYFNSTVKPMAKISLDKKLSLDDASEIALSYIEPQIHIRTKQYLAIAPIPEKDKYVGRLVWYLEFRTKMPLGLWVFWVDAENGKLLYAANEMPRASGSITGNYLPNYYDDTPLVGPFPYEGFTVDGHSGTTDWDGNFVGVGSTGSSHTFHTTLSGTYCAIADSSYPVAEYTGNYTSDTINFFWDMSASWRQDQINLYYHTNWIHHWVKTFLGYNAMDYQMPAVCNDPYDEDNAYWDGYGINFGGGGTALYNLALFADIIYHEYTHGVTHHIYPGDALPYTGQSGAIDEALSDYFPCSIFDDPLMGERAYRSSPTEYMRNLNNSNRYPDDFVGEVHYDDQIIAGAWWDIRSELGAEYTDSLVHFARFSYPATFEEFLYAILGVDDDDGNLSNGTPNASVIYNSFHNHGIGPENFLTIEHTPLTSTEDTLTPLTVEAEIISVLGLDSVVVAYRILGEMIWYYIPMTNTTDDNWSAEIPRQPLGTTVQYYIYAQDVADNYIVSPPAGAANPYTFSVAIDTIPPEIEHIPLTRGNVSAWSPIVFAKISDAYGVGGASVQYMVNDISYPPVDMEYDSIRDGWSAQFPCTVGVGDVVKYRIIGYDNSISYNIAFYPSSDTWVEFDVGRNYIEHFESGGYDYRHYSTMTDYPDEWHLETGRVHSGEYSYKFGGNSLEAYSDLTDGVLETPSIYVSSEDTLTFYQYMDAETSNIYTGYAWDGGIIEISTDGGSNWSQITPQGGYPFLIHYNEVSPFSEETPCFSGHREWQKITFLIDTNGYVKFRFHFGADGYVTREGWYIDDIKVTNHNWVYVLDGNKWRPEKLAINLSPNPFNGAVSIQTSVPKDGNLKIEILDINGRIVDKIFDGISKTGILRLIWQPTDIPAGIYLARASTQGNVAIQKIFYVK